MESVFWMLWVPGSKAPKVRHNIFAEAVAEAERLLTQTNVEAVYVLRAQYKVALADQPTKWETLDDGGGNDG